LKLEDVIESQALRTMNEILGTKINIKFWKSILELEIKRNA